MLGRQETGTPGIAGGSPVQPGGCKPPPSLTPLGFSYNSRASRRLANCCSPAFSIADPIICLKFPLKTTSWTSTFFLILKSLHMKCLCKGPEQHGEGLSLFLSSCIFARGDMLREWSWQRLQAPASGRPRAGQSQLRRPGSGRAGPGGQGSITRHGKPWPEGKRPLAPCPFYRI